MLGLEGERERERAGRETERDFYRFPQATNYLKPTFNPDNE